MAQRWTVEEPYLVVQGDLLEGPLYDEHRQRCRFIDIIERKLYTFSTIDGPTSLEMVETPETVGVTAGIKGKNNELVVAARDGFAILNATNGALTYIRQLPGGGKSSLRFNDGAVDCRGRFWAGTMVDPELVKHGGKEGSLYRLDPDLGLQTMLTSVGTPNGIGWNASNTVMYWTDSVDRIIYAFGFNAETGELSGRREFWNAKTAGLDDGVNPDGLVVDEEDCVWTALWRGSKVLRIDPEGAVVGELILPTAYVTCPVFVGRDLVVTTARDPLGGEAGVRRGGDVYRTHVGVAGVTKYEFTMPESGLQ